MHQKAEMQIKPIHGTKILQGRVAPPYGDASIGGLPHLKIFLNFFVLSVLGVFFSKFFVPIVFLFFLNFFSMSVKFCKVVFYCL